METSSELQQPANKIDFKERLKLILKFALVGVVFWFLYQKGLITGDSFRRLFASPLTVLICTGLMAINTLLGALRWQVLLRTQGAVLPLWEVVKLNLVGSFFNIALPGAVSGDFVKAVYVAKQFPDKRAPVFGSMLFDRLLGASAMILVGAFSALVSRYTNWGGALPPVLLYSIGAIGCCVIGFFIYLFLSHTRDPLFSVLRFFTKRSEKLGVIDRLYHGVMSYRAYPFRILKAIALSLGIHVLLVLMAFFITESISATPISVVALAVVVPIGMLATTIPVLPAGVGTGHAAFYALFQMIGSSQGAEVFSLIVLYQVVVGLIGGLVYLRISTRKN